MKRTFKKVLCLALTLILASFVFAGCGEKADDGTYSIGICQLVQHEALDQATQGFKDALTEKLGDKVSFDEQNASGEPTNCTTIVSQFVSNEVDLIMANATGALTAAAEATQDIPIVATSITDYATALGMTEWTGTSGFNVTGTSDLAPLDQQAAMIKELVPDVKTVGILYCSAEPNSKYQATEVTKALNALGITEVKEYTFVDTNDVTAVTQQAASENDVIYIPTDNTAASNAEAINNVTEPAGIPVVTGDTGTCGGCGVAVLGISYYDLGYRTGEMAYEILVNGADPATMEIEFAKDAVKQYVPQRAEALGITIPEDYKVLE